MTNQDIRTLYHELLSLALFRRLLNGKVFQCLLHLLQTLDGGSADLAVRIDAYGRFTAALFERGCDLTDLVIAELEASEDAYIRSLIAGDAPSPCLRAALNRELSILQRAADLQSAQLLPLIAADIDLPAWPQHSADLHAIYEDFSRDLATRGYGIFARSSMFKIKDGEIVPVPDPEYTTLEHLYGYARERQDVLRNTEALAKGRRASNVLLYGDAGTGKSSTVKACAAAYADQGVRLIEFKKSQIHDIPEISERLRTSPLKFIFYIDDLSFGESDENFYALKGILEGNISDCSSNIVVYATSNRRHLVKERQQDREGGDLHRNDTIQESLSLSARFGLTVTFQKPAKELYLEIVRQLADEYGLAYEPEELCRSAEAFAIRASGRSPRTAKQFIILASIGISPGAKMACYQYVCEHYPDCSLAKGRGCCIEEPEETMREVTEADCGAANDHRLYVPSQRARVKR